MTKMKIKEMYKILRVLCGPTRFKIVMILKEHKQGLTVSEISRRIDSSLSRISHQLRILKAHKLVTAKGINREVIYTLANHRLRRYLSF